MTPQHEHLHSPGRPRGRLSRTGSGGSGLSAACIRDACPPRLLADEAEVFTEQTLLTIVASHTEEDEKQAPTALEPGGVEPTFWSET